MKPIKFPLLAATFMAVAFLCYPAQAYEHTPLAEMPKWCEDMVKMHEDFLKLLKTQDADLTAQAEKIKSAPENQKTQLIETTLLLMIEQQSAQHSEMQKMVAQMKDYMPKNKCPMMNEKE